MEVIHLETDEIRAELDSYKSKPTAEQREKVLLAFAKFDEQVKNLESIAELESGEEKEQMLEQIADLKHRRQIHWQRYINSAGNAPVV